MFPGVPCPSPGKAVNAELIKKNGSATDTGRYELYACKADSPIHIAGSLTITCDKYGEWSGRIPVCAGNIFPQYYCAFSQEHKLPNT